MFDNCWWLEWFYKWFKIRELGMYVGKRPSHSCGQCSKVFKMLPFAQFTEEKVGWGQFCRFADNVIWIWNFPYRSLTLQNWNWNQLKNYKNPTYIKYGALCTVSGKLVVVLPGPTEDFRGFSPQTCSSPRGVANMKFKV